MYLSAAEPYVLILPSGVYISKTYQMYSTTSYESTDLLHSPTVAPYSPRTSSDISSQATVGWRATLKNTVHPEQPLSACNSSVIAISENYTVLMTQTRRIAAPETDHQQWITANY